MLHSLLRILHLQDKPLKELLDSILGEAVALTGCNTGLILLYDETEREFLLESATGDMADELRSVWPDADRRVSVTGSFDKIVSHGKPLVFNKNRDGRKVKFEIAGLDISPERLLAVPVDHKKPVEAVIVACNRETDYTPDDVKLLGDFAGAAWRIAGQRKRQQDESETRRLLLERVKELACLNEISRVIESDMPYEEFCPVVADLITKGMSNPVSSFAVIELMGQHYYQDREGQLTDNYIESAIACGRERYGTVRVYYPAGMPFLLPEEKDMTDQAARQIGSWVKRQITAERLRQKEEDISITLHSIGDGVIATDLDGRVVRMNPVAENITGWASSEACGKKLDEVITLVNAHTRAHVENPVTGVLRDGKTIGLANHTVLIAKDGKELQIADSASPIKNKQGNIRGVVFVFSDITVKYQITEELRRSEERYRLLAENTEIILWEYDIQSDRWIYVAPQVERILGWEPGEWKDLAFWKGNLHPEDREWASSYCKECTMRGEDHVFEYRFRRKDGTYAWLNDEVKVRMENGKPVRLLGSLKDITDRKLAEIAMRESEASYRAIFDTSPDVIFINTPEGIAVDANRGFTEFTGYARDEIVGKSTLDLNIWKSPGAREELIKRLNKGETLRGYEAKINCKNGTVKTALISASLVTLGNKKLVISYGKDITGRKHLELLQKVQHRIADQALFAKSQDELFEVVRNELGHLFDTSNFVIALHDSERDVLSAPFEKGRRHNIDEWPVEGSVTGKVIRGGKPIILDKDEIVRLADAGEINIYGSVPEKWLGAPLHLGGRVSGAIIVQSYSNRQAYDTASLEFLEAVANQLSGYIERKSIELSGLKLSRAVEQSPVSIIITDPEGVIEYVNPKFVEITGYAYEEVIGKKPSILKSGEHGDDFYRELYNTVFSGKDWIGEMLNKKKCGGLFWESAVISPVFNETGDIINLIGVKEDITEKKRLIGELVVAKEKAEESDRLKTSFLANMSHEIRTPMNSIVGFSGLLRRTQLDEKKKNRYIEMINSNAEHLLELIGDILDLSRLESGSIEIAHEQIQTEELFRDVAERFMHYKPEVEIRYDARSVTEFMGDKIKLNQILSNLVSNALKFTSHGFIEFSVKIDRGDLLFGVQDTGTGIRKDDQVRIFDRFVQGSHGIWMSRSGTGLGLSIAKAFVHKMGGDIWVESEWGRGSTFWFTVPFKPVG